MPAHSPTPSPGVSGWGSGSWQAKLLEKLPENMRCKLIQVPPGGSHTTCLVLEARTISRSRAWRVASHAQKHCAQRGGGFECGAPACLKLHSAISGGCSLGRWCTAHDCRAGNVSDQRLRHSTLGFGEHPTAFPNRIPSPVHSLLRPCLSAAVYGEHTPVPASGSSAVFGFHMFLVLMIGEN